MSRAVDGERLAMLRMLAGEVVAAQCFPAFKLASNDDSEADIARNRALMALVAADEMGSGLVDALNRARFDEHGLSFAPDPNKLTLEQHIIGAQQYAVPADPLHGLAESMAKAGEATAAVDAGLRIPKGYMSPEKPMGEASIGELAVFYEEATKKNEHNPERLAAWRVLAAKLPTQSALELGKLTRWILNKHHQPARREMFQDVLTVAEKRLEELGGAS